ncbi:MFS transporter [Natronorarus salvus]|uniref:MFS transporter n=1 Tax=Natronorarus salvus TaxID=3117733 RepID=UPI002F26A015
MVGFGFDVDRRVLALAFARMADGVGNSFLIIVLPLYIASGLVSGRTFGLTESAIIGIVLSTYGLLNSVSQPLTGYLSDRTGRRQRFILVGLAILALMNLVYLVVSSYAALVGIRVVQGIAVAFIVPASIALVNELATAGNRGGNMGVYNTFRLIGFGAGPVVAGAVVAAGPYSGLGLSISGFDAAFYVAAGTAALSFVLVAILVSDPETVERSRKRLRIAVRDPTGETALDTTFTLGLASLFMATSIALFATLQPQVNVLLDQGSTWFGVQFAAFVLAQVLLQTPIGRASDHLGRKPFLLAGLVLLGPTTLVQGFVPTSELMFLARFAQGVAGAMVFAPALALAGDLATGGDSGKRLAVLTMAFGLGIAAGPLLAGFLVPYGFPVPFAFGAGLSIVGLVLVYTQVEETIGVGTPTETPEPASRD